MTDFDTEVEELLDTIYSDLEDSIGGTYSGFAVDVRDCSAACALGADDEDSVVALCVTPDEEDGYSVVKHQPEPSDWADSKVFDDGRVLIRFPLSLVSPDDYDPVVREVMLEIDRLRGN